MKCSFLINFEIDRTDRIFLCLKEVTTLFQSIENIKVPLGHDEAYLFNHIFESNLNLRKCG